MFCNDLEIDNVLNKRVKKTQKIDINLHLNF